MKLLLPLLQLDRITDNGNIYDSDFIDGIVGNKIPVIDNKNNIVGYGILKHDTVKNWLTVNVWFDDSKCGTEAWNMLTNNYKYCLSPKSQVDIDVGKNGTIIKFIVLEASIIEKHLSAQDFDTYYN